MINYYFTFNKVTGDLNIAVVIYMNTYSAGFNTNANCYDLVAGIRKAISKA